MAITTYISMRW